VNQAELKQQQECSDEQSTACHQPTLSNHNIFQVFVAVAVCARHMLSESNQSGNQVKKF